MHRLSKVLLAAALALVVGGLGAHAADQTILGRLILVKNPVQPQPDERKIKIFAKEYPSPNTIVGDPTSGGATLRVVANGTTSTDQTFDMPAAGWTGDPVHGFRYRTTGASAVKIAILKAAGGKFYIKAGLSGAIGPIDVVPPNPGTDAAATLTIGGGDRYCSMFGGTAGGVVVNFPFGNPFKVFKIKYPTAETGCPPGSPSGAFLDGADQP